MIALYLSAIFFCVLLAPGIATINLLSRRPSAEILLIGAMPVSVIAVHYLWFAATLIGPTTWHFIPFILGAVGLVAVFRGWRQTVVMDRLVLFGLTLTATTVIVVLLRDIGDGMFSNDQLISWNRWATDWIGGRLPVRTYEYPQIIPIIYASAYSFFGGDQFPSIARQTASLAFLAAPLALVATRQASMVPALVAMAVLLYLAGTWPTSGMADIPVGAFVLAAFIAGGQKSLILGSVCIAAAALTKQSGLFFLVSYVAFVAIEHRSLRACTKAFMPAALLIAPWLIYKQVGIVLQGERSVVAYTMNDIHGNASYLERMAGAVDVVSRQWLGTWGLIVVAALLLLSLRDKTARRLICLAIGPYALTYMLFFGYDTRNALPVLPLVSWAIGLGIVALPWPAWRSARPLSVSAAAVTSYTAGIYLVAALAWSGSTFGTIATPLSVLPDHERQESYRVGSPVVVRALLAALPQVPLECHIFTGYVSLAFNGYFKDRIRPADLSESGFESLLEKKECGLLLLVPAKPATEIAPPAPPALPAIEKEASAGTIRLIHDGGTFRIYGL